MRAIKRSIAAARDEREAREREAHEAREAREREAREHEAREREAREREARDLVEVDENATCEHVTRELTTRIDTRAFPRNARGADIEPIARNARRADIEPLARNARRADIEPLRCEPCPRVLPSRRLFDGSILQHFQCDGTCARDQRRATEKARMHAQQHAARDRAIRISKRELHMQIAITTVLALFATMWIVLAAREANADTTAGPARRGSAQRARATSARVLPPTVAADDADRDHEVDRDDDDDAIDVAAPPTLDAPFGAPVVAPPIAEVLAAAYRTAGLDRDLGSGLVRRARLAGLVPLLTVRTGRDTNWRDDASNVSRGVTLEVRATWRLDRLLFDGRELQVAALEGARRRERRRLAARVIQVYFAWKRAARSVGIQPRSAAVAEEAAAQLDDLTDGWFTESREAPRP